MANTQAPIAKTYSAFNDRDIDSALALMTENLTWPKASEGGTSSGRKELTSSGPNNEGL